MKKKIVIILIMFFIIGEAITLSLIFKKENSKTLESVQISNTFKDKKQMISIQIQNDNDYDYHEAEDRTQWPDKSIYTYAGSTCINKDGTEIDSNGIITFDEVTYTADIQTKNTVFCTLYFTKGKKALDHLKVKSGNQLQTAAKFGLYRYKGCRGDATDSYTCYDKVDKNYICFGTTDIATCTGTDKRYYMYRIIGITDGSTTNTRLGLEANQLKIIRAYPSSTSQNWQNGYDSAQWETSKMTTYLNESFLTTDKTKWKNDYWEGIISNQKWYIGYHDDDGEGDLSVENNYPSSKTYKVGLMYRSDYYNACETYCWTDNWLFIANGMKGNPSVDEWTMTYCSTGGGESSWWMINTDASIERESALRYSHATRPAFYLKSNVTLAGEGTEASPFIITSKY